MKIIPVGNADTVIITEDELDDIRSSYGDEDEEEEDDYGDDDYGEEEDGEEHDSDEVNPRMNKVIRIMTIVVAVIIILVLALVVAGPPACSGSAGLRQSRSRTAGK